MSKTPGVMRENIQIQKKKLKNLKQRERSNLAKIMRVGHRANNPGRWDQLDDRLREIRTSQNSAHQKIGQLLAEIRHQP